MCFFCGQFHSSEYWDEVDASVEQCRQKAGAQSRGDLDNWNDDTIPIRCEAGILRDPPVVEQERAA